MQEVSDDELAELHALETACGADSLIEYVSRLSPRWVPPWHLSAVADLFARAEYGPIRATVSVAARFGKTELLLHAMCWWLSRHPTSSLAYVSYGADLAHSKSKRCLDLARESGLQVRKDIARASEWQLITGGGLRARGVGGGLTGHGADCFPAGTMVSCEHGQVPIEDVVKGTKVWGFDHFTGEVVLKDVVAIRVKRSEELVTVSTSGGRQLTATEDHRVHVGGGDYRPARVLGQGDKLTVWKVRGLRLQPSGTSKVEVLPRMLRQGEDGNADDRVRMVFWSLLDSILRVQEGCKKRGWQSLLRSSVLWEGVRRGSDGHDTTLLEVPDQEASKAGRALRRLSFLWRAVRAKIKSAAVLLKGLRQQGPLRSHAREGELPSSDRRQRDEGSRSDAPIRSPPRPGRVRSLRDRRSHYDHREWAREDEPSRSSHRRGPDEQRPRKPDYTLLHVPCDSPQVGEDSVSMVRPVRGGQIDVYDIQVEGTGNFFANEILVHNCMIIDDPHKNREDAESANIRQKTWDWFTSTALTRIEPGGSCIVVHTRWTPDDLIGRIIRGDAGNEWTHVNIPAIDEYGESSWPWRWPNADLQLKKDEVGEYDWASMYMGQPRPRGGKLFGEATFYREFPDVDGARILIICDPAATAKSHNDASAIVVAAAKLGTNGLPTMDILEVHSLHVAIPVLCGYLQELQQRWAAPIGVESVGAFVGVPDTIRAHNRALQVFDVPALSDKFTRALPAAAAWNSGRIRVPMLAKWLSPFLGELALFTGLGDKHDDMVDALSHAYNCFSAMLQPERKTDYSKILPFGA